MKTLIYNADIFDGESTVFTGASILFDQSGILALGHDLHTNADMCIDAQGRCVTPGLFDCHVHLGIDPRRNTKGDTASALMIAAQARRVWTYGITTLRNMGTKGNLDIHVRNLINENQFPGCRIVASGESISITGGHAWFLGIECDTVDEVRKAARLQLRNGARLIKLFATGGMMTEGSDPLCPQLTQDQMAAAVEEAERLGVATAAHATGLEGARNAIRAGVSTIEHTMLDRDTVRMMKEHGTYYCSTIGARAAIHQSTAPSLEFVRRKCKPDDLENMLNALRYCREFGVPIASGTDAADDDLLTIGPSLKDELMIYAQAGYTPMEILRCATSTAADMCRVSHETGRLSAGLMADIVVFDQSPLKDIANVGDVLMTFQSGTLRYVKGIQT